MMLFYKKHKLVVEKPLNIIKSDFKSKTENLKVIELSETKLQGIIDLPFNRNTIESDITLFSETNEKVIIEFKNTLQGNIVILVLFFIVCWGIALNEIISGEEIFKFEIVLPIIFPIIGVFFQKISLDYYDKKIMAIFKSLLSNKEPN